jgi:centromeric protein E
MASSSSRTRSSRPPSPASSTSSSHLSNRLIPRSNSTSASSLITSAAGIASRSMTPSRTFSDSGLIGSGSFGIGSPVPYPSEELLGDPMDDTISSERDSISVTVRFRPLSDREYQRGDEVAWYPDGDTLVRHEYNPLTAYAFGIWFTSQLF